MNKRVRESGSSYRKKREKRDKEDAKLKGAMEKVFNPQPNTVSLSTENKSEPMETEAYRSSANGPELSDNEADKSDSESESQNDECENPSMAKVATNWDKELKNQLSQSFMIRIRKLINDLLAFFCGYLY